MSQWLFACLCVEVYKGIYRANEVAAKVLRDKSALQSLLTEASVMT